MGSRMRNKKMSQWVALLGILIGGACLFTFQNCGQIQTSGLAVNDLAGRTAGTREFIDVGDDSVTVQIQDSKNNILNIDEVGNQTVINPQMEVAVQPKEDKKTIDSTESLPQVSVSDLDEEDMVSCQAIEVSKGSANSKNAIRTAVYSNQRIHCDRKKHDGESKDKKSCLDLIQQNGVNAIDISKMGNLQKLVSIKGFTVIYSSDPSVRRIRSVIIDQAVGKTVLCGVEIDRVDVKKGSLILKDGSNVRSCGEIKGVIKRDDSSMIQGSIDMNSMGTDKGN